MEERRRASDERIDKHEVEIALLKDGIKHLTNSVDDIKESLKEAAKTKMTWWVSIVGVIITVLVQTFVIAYFYGGLSKQVEVNSSNISDIIHRLDHHLEVDKKENYGHNQMD